MRKNMNNIVMKKNINNLAEPYRSAAREAIARVAAKAELSPDTREIVTRSLAD